jgi:hypothetical protein
MRIAFWWSLTLLSGAVPFVVHAQARAPQALKAAQSSAVSDYAEPAWLRRATLLTAGVARRGSLAAQDSTLESGSTFQVFRYPARRGERIDISLRSTAFDGALMVLRFGPGPLRTPEVLAENDDWDKGTDARIVLRSPSTEDLLIVVSAVAPPPEGIGAYAVELSSIPPVNWARVYPGGGSPDGKYAVIVGISDYPGRTNDLWGPREDAQRMAKVLIERFGFPRRNVVVITDSSATRERIAQAVLRHLGQAGPDGSALFYFSGHGLPIPANEGLGEEIDPEPDGRDEAIFVWDPTGEGTHLLDDELGQLVQRLKTRRTLVILDACYSGSGTRGPSFKAKRLTRDDVAASYRSPRALQSAVILDTAVRAKAEDEDMPESHVLLAASRSDEVAWADSLLPERAGQGSLFTWVLERELRRVSPQASVESFMRPVIAATVAVSRSKYESEQTPQVEGTRISLPLSEFLGDTVTASGTAKGAVPYRRPKKKP